MTFYIDSISEGTEGVVFGIRPEYPESPHAVLTPYKIEGVLSMTDGSDADKTVGEFPADYAGCDDGFIYVAAAAIAANYKAVTVTINDFAQKLTFGASGDLTAQVGDALTAAII